MADLNKLSPAALKAAMTGGTSAWGKHGSIDHARYCEVIPKEYRKRARMCRCGCRKRNTHIGMANGVGLSWGCELRIRRWVRDPASVYGPAPATDILDPKNGEPA